MYALRERRVHVTQEDFELAVAKVKIESFGGIIFFKNYILGYAKRFGEKCFIEKTLEVINLVFFIYFLLHIFFLFVMILKRSNKSRDQKTTYILILRLTYFILDEFYYSLKKKTIISHFGKFIIKYNYYFYMLEHIHQ
jgi:hypothetical protein